MTIATGGYRADALVTSLRDVHRGDWRGPVYVYSDGCAPPIPMTQQINVSHATRLHAKRLKMHVLEDTSPQFKYVLFLDSDIQLSRPIQLFFDAMPPWEDTCDAYMPHDVWYSNRFVYNAGMIVLRRTTSERFLQAWLNATESSEYVGNKDQPALAALIESGAATICTLPDKLLHYSTSVLSRWSAYTSVFTHYLTKKTNVRQCKQLGRKVGPTDVTNANR